MSNQIIKYQTMQGEVELSPQIIKQYLVNGDADKITDQEVHMFLELCKYRKLNPFLKEAYLIKFGNYPASLVISYDVFKQRAELNTHYKGYKAGIIVIDNKNELVYRVGALKLPNEQVVGGWCEVYRDDYKEPARIEVAFDEYVGTKKDGTLNRQWAEKPAFMIRKVAIAQGLREAFPNDFDGLYLEEENAPIVSNNIETIEAEVIETITKQEAMELYARATSLSGDKDKGLELVKKALVDLGLRDKTTPTNELNLGQLLKTDFEAIKEKIKELH